ncbi:MAG: macrocin O-methyltransferase [Campylobacterales bacterium]|nr:macrocin O-methyltransferase [Campylobacterales bacterium]
MSRFKSRQNFAKDLCYYELVKQTKGVAGDIFECGVYYGNSLMNYANLSVALEPYNYQCKIVGFDTFEGGVGISSKDLNNPYFERKDGEYYADSYEDLQQSIEIFDLDRPLNHLEKVRLIKGDIRVEGEKYLINNPQTVIRILSLTMNFYEPTKFALENFYPRLAVGGILVINGLNHAAGATVALNEFLGIGSSRIKVFDFYPNITYMIKE